MMDLGILHENLVTLRAKLLKITFKVVLTLGHLEKSEVLLWTGIGSKNKWFKKTKRV